MDEKGIFIYRSDKDAFELDKYRPGQWRKWYNYWETHGVYFMMKLMKLKRAIYSIVFASP